MKVLLFSSICKPTSIFNLTLQSFFNLSNENFTLDFCFYNDNVLNNADLEESLINYKNSGRNVIDLSLENSLLINKSEYKDHNWDYNKIDRIINIKNEAIRFAIENDYDFLFLVDSDLVLNPNLLEHLISLKKDFVFEVFWTIFFGDNYYKPNAWDFHSWAYYNSETILKLAKPGTYKVGGGGACTLLSKRILDSGINFNRLESLSFQGEDRHFCTKAQAHGFDVFIDTHYPCYHIFQEDQILEAEFWYKSGAKPVFFTNWLNEEWVKRVKKIYEKKENEIFIDRLYICLFEIKKSIKKLFIN